MKHWNLHFIAPPFSVFGSEVIHLYLPRPIQSRFSIGTCFEDRPCEDIPRSQSPATQEESAHQDPNQQALLLDLQPPELGEVLGGTKSSFGFSI